MLASWIGEEGRLAERFVVGGEALEGILAGDIWDVREGCQAGGIDEAGGCRDLRVGGAGDLPCFVWEFGDVGDRGVEMDARAEGSTLVDVGVYVGFQICRDVLGWEEIVVLL